MRFNEDGTPARDFPLNRLKSPPGILVAADNFGCGSSREAAVYALMDYGVQVIIAPSFADIFHSNAGKNGLLTFEQPAKQVEKLLALLSEKPGTKGEVDLSAQSWRIGPFSGAFEIAPRLKYRLETGLDELSANSGTPGPDLRFREGAPIAGNMAYAGRRRENSCKASVAIWRPNVS